MGADEEGRTVACAYVGPRQVSSNLSTLTVSVERFRTNTPRALKRSPEAFVMMSVIPGREDLAVLDERVRPMANEPITRRNRPVSDSDGAGTVGVDGDQVPTYVTVMGLPVHGFTSGNTSSIGNSVRPIRRLPERRPREQQT